MKKIVFSLCVALLMTISSSAQQISVVSSGGATTLYQTLPEAINGASDGSVIYLPGGVFPISDEVKISKKLTIIGIGHKINNNNVDGISTINGNIFFNEGSSGSAIMGCYLTGKVSIGEGGTSVNDVLVRFCNLNAVVVNNNTCIGNNVNQNYIRSYSSFGNSVTNITNNIMCGINYLSGGIIKNNIFIGGIYTSRSGYPNGSYAFLDTYNCTMSNNIFIVNAYEPYHPNNIASYNMGKSSYGDDFINIGDTNWDDIFINYNGGSISSISNFHFKDAYKQYENQVGIYGGTGFNDQQLAPVPYVVAKHVDEQTDASGKLNIKIRVKAGQ